MASPYTFAEEMLSQSSAARGLGNMERTAALKGPNMYDTGAASKVAVNPQPYNNERLTVQNEIQNQTTALSGAQADAVMDVRKQSLLESNIEKRVHDFREGRKAEVASVLGSPALLEMSRMNSVENAKFRNDIATVAAQARGINPALMQESIA